MTARAILRALAVVSILAAACSDPAEPPLPSFSVSPAAQWSGGLIFIRSEYFLHHLAVPVVVAGTDTLAYIGIDDSTVFAQLPPGPSGPVTLSLVRGTRRDNLGTVQRVGLREKRTLTPGLMGEVMIVDSGGHPWAMGNTITGAAQYAPMGRIDLVTGAGQTFTSIHGPSTVQYGWSPSVPSGSAVARDAGDTLHLYDLRATPPQPIGGALFGGQTGYIRHLVQLSPGLWLHTQSHFSFTHAETDTTTWRVGGATESPWSVFVSPRGDRTTMTVNVVTGGVPVFDNISGDTAFSLRLKGTEGIVFSPSGDTLYAVGGDYSLPDTIVIVNATTGASLHPKVHLPGGFIAFSLAYSTAGGGRLLVGAADTTTLALLVYDARTLELLGILSTDDTCGPQPMTGNCWYGAVAVDDARHVAYLVVPDGPTPVWTFDVLDTP